MKSTVYLQPSLANHRRGRLLGRLLDAKELEEHLPDSGVILAIGQDFQNMESAEQSRLKAWCQLSGRTLLLLPPYREGEISSDIDWTLDYNSTPSANDPSALAGILCEEVTQAITGSDGSFDSTADYQWQDSTPNCRYLKSHSGTGVFAATTLPLWSISLMGKAEQLSSWLNVLHAHAGVALNTDKSAAIKDSAIKEIAVPSLEPVDYTTMVCIYGWRCSEKNEFLKKVFSSEGVALISIDLSLLEESINRLQKNGCLVTAHILSETSSESVPKKEPLSLSEQGLNKLKASPYWGYAEGLYSDNQGEHL